MQRTKRAIIKRTAKPGLSKFQRYRRLQKSKGMRLLRIWVPDTHSPQFAKEAARQGRLLRGCPEEKEAMAFIESVVEWPEP